MGLYLCTGRLRAGLELGEELFAAVEFSRRSHERELFTHQILDQTYGLEREKPDYIDDLITDFSHLTMVLGDRHEHAS
jgi:hypothetical protein